MNGGIFFAVCINIRAVTWKIARTFADKCRVYFVNDSTVLNELELIASQYAK